MSDLTQRVREALAGLYTIERELGRGGMATVYLATDLKHNREVAVKVLHPELAATLGHERFLREIEIVAALTHPRILTLIDSGEAGGFLYYVMPFVDGETLKQRIQREGQLPLDEALGIAREIVDALAYAHTKGVIHRDIKPSNVLFEAGHSVIADFGVARAVGVAGGGDATATGLAVGTPKYMSPEQAAGDEVDGRADLYSVGCVLWEMLAGEAPFDGPTPQVIVAMKSSDRTPSVRVRRKDVPSDVEGVIAKAMAFQAADRYTTAEDLDRALAAPEFAEKLKPRGAGRRLLAIAAAALFVVAGAWWITRSTPEAGAAGFVPVAVLPMENVSGDSEEDPFVAGAHQALIGQLGRIGGLRTISRRSVLRYAGSEKSISEIAAELGVDYLVDATVVREGGAIHLQVNLIQAVPEERQLWAQAYDREASEVMALHGEVARAIASALDIDLTPEEEARLAGSRPVNPETYEAYLRGMYSLTKGTAEDFQKGMQYLNEAVEADPGDALAWAGLASGYVTLGHGPAPPEGVWSLARAAVDRALGLDPDLAEAHAASADIMLYGEWDWEGAEREFGRANELNPSMPMNHYHYAWYLYLFDRWDEAVEEHELAQQLDPLTPPMSAWLSGMYRRTGRHDQALAQAREVLERWPGNPIGQVVLGNVLLDAGRYDEAIEAAEAAVAVNPAWRGGLAVAYAQAGREAEARAELAELEAQPLSGWNALMRARVHVTLGEHDEAFELLAFEPPHGWLPFIRVGNGFAPLREDPRFAALMEKLNFPAPAAE
jgi:serine/threonine-protein kinase